MRYQHWDVLLFPGPSRVPIQEFETKFHVLTSASTPSAASASIEDPFIDRNNQYDAMNKLPLLTCFVASQIQDTPFRVSIHSWARPTASSALSAFKTKEEAVAFQARVYIDGAHQCSRTLSETVLWPEILEYSDSTHARPGAELRFPPFHPEILQQANWDAAEQRGRIRIVLAEGVLRGNVFDRLRDVIAFSFQHAPLHVLEHAALAWPNPRAFATAPRPARVASRVGGHEAHAHTSAAPKATQMFEDPFVRGPSLLPQWRLRTHATDESMPDAGGRRNPSGSEMSIETTHTTRSASLAKRKRAVSEGSDMIGAGGLQGIKIG